jgi:hypothetical protein
MAWGFRFATATLVAADCEGTAQAKCTGDCVWCTSAAVPGGCYSKSDVAKLPPAVFKCGDTDDLESRLMAIESSFEGGDYQDAMKAYMAEPETAAVRVLQSKELDEVAGARPRCDGLLALVVAAWFAAR